MKTLWIILRSLSHWEQKRLRKYLDSPYFNTDDRMQLVLEALLAEELPTKQVLFARVCPGEPYSSSRFHNLISYLRAHVEAWLSQEQLREDPFPLALARLRFARNRGLHPVFTREIQRQQADSPSPVSLENLLQAYWLFEEQDLYQLANRQPQSAHLLRQMESLTDFHTLALLKGACQWVNRKQVVQIDPSHALLLDEYVQQALALPLRGHGAPLIRLYQLLLDMLGHPMELGKYPPFSQALHSQADYLPDEEFRALCQYGQNYCIRQVNRGKEAFLAELFELYRVLLARDLMYYQGYLQDADIKNMVALGVRLGKFDWAEAFLSDYTPRIAPAKREEVLAYNRAYLYHAKGELRRALRLLSQVDFEDVYYELGISTLLLKIYYELEDHEGLDAQLRAFEQRLSRNRLISTYQRRGHLTLIKVLRKMDQFRIRRVLYSPKQRAQQLAKLRNLLGQHTEVINLTWLQARMTELE